MEEKKYYNDYMVATRNFVIEAKDEMIEILRNKGYNVHMPTMHNGLGLDVAIYGNYVDSVGDDGILDGHLYKIDGSDVTVVSCTPYMAERLFAWVNELPIIKLNTNLIEHVMTFKTNEEADYAAGIIHGYLSGNKDYVESAILLNIDNNKVTLIIGDEASKDSKHIAMSAIFYAMNNFIE